MRVQQRTEGRSLSLGMRDSDRDFHAKLVVRRDAGIRSLADLAGKTPRRGQPRLDPGAHPARCTSCGRRASTSTRVTLLPFDTDLGKHGDTGTSELDVLRGARTTAARRRARSATWSGSPSRRPAASTRALVEVLWTTPGFDHCMFDALPTLGDGAGARRSSDALFAMSWEEPAHRRLLELEGLKQWMPPREDGLREPARGARRDADGW